MVEDAAALRLVIAEDVLITREGIVAMLEAQRGVAVVGLAGDLPELLAAVEEHEPDVVLTDIRMPPTNQDEGIRAASSLRSSHPSIGVVVLSQYTEAAWALELFAEGSDGRAYLLKERVSEPEQLVAAIREVARGGSVVDPKVVEALLATTAGRGSPLEHLSPRELDVLAEIAQGKSNAAVADALVLSLRAVEKHINSLFSKLGLSGEADVHRRVKAVLLYLSETGAIAPRGAGTT